MCLAGAISATAPTCPRSGQRPGLPLLMFQWELLRHRITETTMQRLVPMLALFATTVAFAQDQELAQLAARYERSRKDDIDAAVAEFVPLFAAAAAERAGTDAAVP